MTTVDSDELRRRIAFAFDVKESSALAVELTEYLRHNITYARSTINRPIELLDHQERLVIFGGRSI